MRISVLELEKRERNVKLSYTKLKEQHDCQALLSVGASVESLASVGNEIGSSSVRSCGMA